VPRSSATARLPLLALLAAGLALGPAPPPAHADDSAVILAYHEFENDRVPSINLRAAQLEAHVAEIGRGGYRALPLADVVAAFRRREALPERTLALTVDSAFESAYAVAWPIFRRAGVPFTLFLQTDALDEGRRGYMTWEQVRELASAGVGIGSLGAAYLRYPDAPSAVRAEDLARSARRIEEELGFRPRLFAYPYGDFGSADRTAVREAGFLAAFGQHSGVAGTGQDAFALPRFLMSEAMGSLERFRLAANALPLPVFDLVPDETVLKPADNPPAVGFTVAEQAGPLDRLACFASNEPEALVLQRLGARRVELRLSQAFEPPRGRLNCTLPLPDGRWRWLGMQFYVSGG